MCTIRRLLLFGLAIGFGQGQPLVSMYFNSALDADKQGNYTLAISYAEMALDVDPARFDAMLLIAGELAQHTQKSDPEMEKKLARAEHYVEHAQNLISVTPRPSSSVTEAAWSTFKRAQTAEAHKDLGLIAGARGQWGLAASEFKETLRYEFAPDAVVMTRLAAAYNETGRYADALALLTELKAIPTLDPRIRAVVEDQEAKATVGQAASASHDAPKGANRPPSVAPIAPTPKAAQPTGLRMSPGDIASSFAGSVMKLENYNQLGTLNSTGSGFMVSNDGLILTNYHVIRGAGRMVARTPDQAVHEVQYVVGFDPQNDVAAVRIGASAIRPVHLGEASTVKTGDHVTVLGSPRGLENTLSDGIISAIRSDSGVPRLQTTAPVSPGSSGGPVFDDYGNVIGIIVSAVESGENLNFAVPIDQAKSVLSLDRQINFSELLLMTQVQLPLLASSAQIPPQVATVKIQVPEQGAVVAGSFAVSGGLSNDIGVYVTTDNGGIVWNGGIVKNSGSLNVRLTKGQYRLVFNNKMGPLWVSPKTITGSINLIYFR